MVIGEIRCSFTHLFPVVLEEVLNKSVLLVGNADNESANQSNNHVLGEIKGISYLSTANVQSNSDVASNCKKDEFYC